MSAVRAAKKAPANVPTDFGLNLTSFAGFSASADLAKPICGLKLIAKDAARATLQNRLEIVVRRIEETFLETKIVSKSICGICPSQNGFFGATDRNFYRSLKAI